MKFKLEELNISTIPTNMIPVTMDQSYIFKDENGKVKEILKINFFQLSEKGKEIKIKLLDQNIFIPSFRKLDTEKGSCITLSESILENLKQYLKTYFDAKNIVYKEDDNIIDFQNIEFMTARTILSKEIIKKDANTYKIGVFNSKKETKYFTKLFYNFIMRRNMITHGKIYFNLDTKDYILEYIDAQSKEKLLCVIDDHFFSNFKECSQIISQHLQALRKLHGK